ncbi:hypothetical protein BGZ67_003030 [Mortierella alpina]|nr:hypothetical protein BGZ67_003030 [Mortierella alpina]
MATTIESELLSVPSPLGSGFCPSSPPGAPPLTAGTAGSGTNSAHSGSIREHLTTLVRSVSNQSHRTSVISSHRSINSVRSHVSSFQNVRFDPDPIKDISFWGGTALLISNMTGPGLVTLPIVAQSAGWLPTVLGFVLVATLSTLSSLFICEAMTEVPGNEYFQSNVEFSNLVECFFGRRYHLLVQIICFLAMQTTNIASIAVSAQLFDNLLIQIFHRTCGFEIYPHPSFVCVSAQLHSASPFSGVMIMTAGVLLALVMILPLALLKLSENIWLQLASFILMIMIVIQWIVTFFMHGLDTTLVPAVGSDIGQTFGTILFNYAFITTVPSWANAKQPSVSIHKTVGWSVTITTTIYLMVAIVGGMAYPIQSNSSLIQAISSSPNATTLSMIAGYTFPIAALITSVPINIIVIRYNLIQSGACNMIWSNLLAGVLPWLIAIPCMTGSGLTTVINWSSLFLVSTANFIIPFILYIYSKRHREKLNRLPIIEMEQHARLSREVSRSSLPGQLRRDISAAGSIRRRHMRFSSQSHPDLTMAPPMAIAAASVIPVAVGIGGSGLVRQSISEDNLMGESSRRGDHRRHYNHQLGSFGLSGTSEYGEPVSGPYFSYSRDGELFERESRTAAMDPSDPRSQASSVHRPSGVSTVILHDPITEMAQRKSALPRRVSHKDKILSMISERHKRAIEQQAMTIEEEQNEKPVPPMILLSQSTAPEVDDEDFDDEPLQFGIHSRESMSSECEKMSGKDSKEEPVVTEPSEVISQATAVKKLNRKSSIIPAHKQSGATLSLSPSSSPPGSNAPPMLELRRPDDPRPGSPFHAGIESTLEASFLSDSLRTPFAAVAPPGLGGHVDIKSMSSMFRSSGSSRDSLKPERIVTDVTRLGPGSNGTSSSTSSAQPHHSPSTPDSAGSVHSLDRQVSFSDEPRLTLSPPELERKPSFGDETKRAMKAAVATLRGVSPSRLTSGSSASYKTRDGRSDAHGLTATLLDPEDDDGCEAVDPRDAEDDDYGAIGPELTLAQTENDQGTLTGRLGHMSQERRDSVGRMAAAFVSQPGSFPIKTATKQTSTSGTAETSGNEDERDSLAHGVPALSFSVTEPCFPQSGEPSGEDEKDDQYEVPNKSFSLSPSVPPSFPPGQLLSGRNHSRTVSAFADLQESSSRSRRFTARVQSTQSLKEKAQHLVAFDPANHLMPPSPSLTQRPRMDPSSPRSAEARDTVGPLFSSNPPSPQRATFAINRASLGNRSSRYGGSKILAAPFQGGNNYSIPGFSSSRPHSSYGHQPPSPGSHPQDQPQSAQGLGSSWFSLRGHSRDPSRSTMASFGRAPSFAGSLPPSPHPSMTEIGKRPVLEHLRDSSIGEDGSGMDAVELERGERQLYESSLHLPQYAVAEVPTFDARWSLRAIPAWVPLSSLQVAWGALVLLAVAICTTIGYDFVQLASGHNVVSA